MKKLFNLLILTLQFSFLSLIISCKNPLFISASGMYEVTFETNGGSSVETLRTDSITKCPVTQKENCDFLGWYITSDFSGNTVTFPFSVKENTILYAKLNQKYKSIEKTYLKEIIEMTAYPKGINDIPE